MHLPGNLLQGLPNHPPMQHLPEDDRRGPCVCVCVGGVWEELGQRATVPPDTLMTAPFSLCVCVAFFRGRKGARGLLHQPRHLHRGPDQP